MEVGNIFTPNRANSVFFPFIEHQSWHKKYFLIFVVFDHASDKFQFTEEYLKCFPAQNKLSESCSCAHLCMCIMRIIGILCFCYEVTDVLSDFHSSFPMTDNGRLKLTSYIRIKPKRIVSCWTISITEATTWKNEFQTAHWINSHLHRHHYTWIWMGWFFVFREWHTKISDTKANFIFRPLVNIQFDFSFISGSEFPTSLIVPNTLNYFMNISWYKYQSSNYVFEVQTMWWLCSSWFRFHFNIPLVRKG